MNIKKMFYIIIITSLALLFASSAVAKDELNPKYSADVPGFLLTPERTETKFLGELEFFDGFPSESTAEKAYDFLDLSRGVETFLSGIPAASIYAILEGLAEAGLKPGDIGIYEELMDAKSLFLTANSTTMYFFTELNIKDEPMVMEVPPMVLGMVDDAFFRWVGDVGLTGADKGAGGKYIFAHRDYKGEFPEGYFVARSSSYRNWVLSRAFVKDGDLAGTAKFIKAKCKVYPLSQAKNPPDQKFVNLSGKKMNTIHANDFQFYEELNSIIQYEPADSFDPELVGLFASIGIKKGQPFAPDARMKDILIDAVAIGNATARAICFQPRKKDVYFYNDRQWFTSFVGGSHEFMNNGELALNDRTMFHYGATGITPAMAMPKVGTGSAYAAVAHDSAGRYLDGGNTYSVTLPAPIPVNNFWSFMVYSGQHRSMLETDQKLAGLDSTNQSVKANQDGSYTIWFGPEAPEGREGNWIQTMPGKSYFSIIRLYGPLQPWFDKTWKPGDLELVQ